MVRLILVIFVGLLSSKSASAGTGKCLLIDKPLEILDCITLNPQMIVSFVTTGDVKNFCKVANSYLTCMRTYIEDCIGGRLGLGALEELMDLNKKCCMGPNTDDCVITNQNLTENCFANDNLVILSNNQTKPIGDIKVGDIVKAVNSQNDIIDSEVVTILHRDERKITKFIKLICRTGERISLTAKHLIYTKKMGFIKANKVKIGDTVQVYCTKSNKLIDKEITKIENEFKRGYVAPMTQSGTILVNQIYSSCYAEINNHYVAHVVMKPLSIWYSLRKFISSFFIKNSNSYENWTGLNEYAHMLHYISLKAFPMLFN